MFFKRKEKKSESTSSYKLGFADGYNAGVSGNAKVFQSTFNKDRAYITGYEQGYRKGNTEYRNKSTFNKNGEITPSQPENNQPDFKRQVEAQREINLGTNNFRRW